MSQHVLMDTLGNIRFLSGVAPTHLKALADVARVEEFEEGDVLFEEGQPVENVYLIVRGEIAVEVSASGLDRQQVFVVGPGESLGWSALLERQRRTATARVTVPATVIRIDGLQLLELCDRNPRLGFAIMRKTAVALAERLSAMRQRFWEVYRLQPASFTCGAEEPGVD